MVTSRINALRDRQSGIRKGKSMRILIGHCKQGLLFDGEAGKIEIIEQDEHTRYIVTMWDGSEKEILAENKYAVIKIGNKKDSQRPDGWLSRDGKPTTYDLAVDYANARKKLIDMGVDIDRISFFMPSETGYMRMYGPMPLDEAQQICYEHWSK